MGRGGGRLGVFGAIAKFLRRSGDRQGRPSPQLGPLDRLRGRNLPEPNARVADMRDFMLPDVDGSPFSQNKSGRLGRLSDTELLNSVFNPRDGWHVQAYRNPPRVVQGNHRIAELLRRARSPDHDIDDDTPLYINFLD